MQLHELKPIHKRKKIKRVGRGGKKGTYSGRGQKGQKARAGRKLKPIIRELIKRYHKLRGFKFKGKEEKPVILNLDILEKISKDKEKISPQALLGKKIIFKIKGKTPRIKILGRGEITKPVFIEGCLVSNQAKEKIERVGGRVKK